MASNLDYLNEAGREISYAYNYWGQVQIDAAQMIFAIKGEPPVPFNPEVHDRKSWFWMIEMVLDLIPGCKANFPIVLRTPDFAKDWQKIGMKSIKDLGFVTESNGADLASLNGKFVHISQVPGFTKNKDPEKENYRTWKFIKIFRDQAECIADFEETQGDGTEYPQQETSTPVASTSKTVALDFVKSFVKAQHDLGKQPDEVKVNLANFIKENAIVSAEVSIDSHEVIAILEEPPF